MMLGSRRDALRVAVGSFVVGSCFGAYALHRFLARRKKEVKEPRREGGLEAPPDYSQCRSWYANYVLDGGANGTRWAPATYVDEQDRASADVFFVHGTTSLEGLGNASVGGEECAKYTHWKVGRQCSCFTHRCRVFAPKYRQARVANYHFFEAHAAADGLCGPLPDYQHRLFNVPVGERAFDVAFSDVVRALEVFLTRHRTTGRPWLLAGHSQGGGHCTRALAFMTAEDAPAWATAALKDLVVALPLGIQHGPDSLRPPLAFAETARDHGVVLVWSTVLPGRRDTYAAGRRRFGYVDNVTVTHQEPLSLNPFVVCGGRHSALCCDGVVRTDVVTSAAADGGLTVIRPNSAIDLAPFFPSPDGDLHVYDFELWWGMIRTTVALRLAAFEDARKPPR